MISNTTEEIELPEDKVRILSALAKSANATPAQMSVVQIIMMLAKLKVDKQMSDMAFEFLSLALASLMHGMDVDDSRAEHIMHVLEQMIEVVQNKENVQ